MVTVVFASLAPAISHALQGQGALGWIEVCTAQGAKWINAAADVDTQGPAPLAAHGLDHCPYCTLQGTALGLLAARAQGVLLALAFEAPRTDRAAPHGAVAWLAAQARAPPQAT
jgi:Protein of unknown function (DUF2946)